MYEPTEYQKDAYCFRGKRGYPNKSFMFVRSGRKLPTRSKKYATQYMIARMVVLIEAIKNYPGGISISGIEANCAFCSVARSIRTYAKCGVCFVKEQCESQTVQDWMEDANEFPKGPWRSKRVLDMLQGIYRRNFE